MVRGPQEKGRECHGNLGEKDRKPPEIYLTEYISFHVETNSMQELVYIVMSHIYIYIESKKPHQKKASFVHIRNISEQQLDSTTSTRQVGSIHYLAPELCEGGRPTAAADCWALGVTCLSVSSRCFFSVSSYSCM